MRAKIYRTTIVREGSMCFIPVPFDPRAVFGKVLDSKEPPEY